MSNPFKICDPIHGFIRFDSLLQAVIDSRPFQRLRYINQLGMTYLIYPGALHTRFEHSLGVMELATRIYDTLTYPHNRVIAFPLPEEEIHYWRHILRIAALCHDLGHLPFSHTAESSLLPDGGHENMTLKLLQSKELKKIFCEIGSAAEADIIKLALADKGEVALKPWEKMLSQIITEDHFGADRIDYLLRDAYYTGVGYGRFDYNQLIDSLRILPTEEGYSIGIVEGGVQSVEALLMARYMMYARVYQHPKVGVYNCHMSRFMNRYYLQGVPKDPSLYLEEMDFKVLHALWAAAKEGDEDASILLKLKPTFLEMLSLREISNEMLQKLIDSLQDKILIDAKFESTEKRQFPVLMNSGNIFSSHEVSSFLKEVPIGKRKKIYVDRTCLTWAEKLLSNET